MKFTKTKISNSIKEATGVSSVYILNQDFKKLEKIDEFLITDEVKKTLDDYYDFNLSLSEINKAEYYNSTELISIYKTSTYVTYESSQFILDNNSLRSTVPLTVDLEDGNAKRIIKIGDKKLAKSDWYVTTINEKVIEDGKEAVFDENAFVEQEVVFVQDKFGYAKLLEPAAFDRNIESVTANNK